MAITFLGNVFDFIIFNIYKFHSLNQLMMCVPYETFYETKMAQMDIMRFLHMFDIIKSI